MSRAYLTACIAPVLVLLAAGVVYVYHQIAPMHLRNMELMNHARIARAMVMYANRNQGTFPSSLKQIVDAGILPNEGAIYHSPYHPESPRVVSFVDSSYYIVLPTNGYTNTPYYIRRHIRGTEPSGVPDSYIEIDSILSGSVFPNSVPLELIEEKSKIKTN